jgi:hypothetical protein
MKIKNIESAGDSLGFNSRGNSVDFANFEAGVIDLSDVFEHSFVKL